MRHHITTYLLFIGLSFVSFNSWSQKVKHKLIVNYYDFDHTQPESRGYYYNDDFYGETTLKHGRWTYWNKQGEKVEERNYFKGELNGVVKAYYNNGNLKELGYFKMGQQDSVFYEWYEDETLKTEGYFRLSRPAEKWSYFYENGYHKREEHFEDSTLYVDNYWLPDSTQTLTDGNGKLYDWFESTGQIKEMYTYQDGLKNGPFFEYNIHGVKMVSGQYVNGEKTGEWTFVYYTGDLDRKMNYDNGKLDGDYIKYYDNGKINVKGHFENGIKDGHWSWYTNIGTVDMEGDFKNGLQDGYWVYWYPGDTIVKEYEGYFKEGLRDGDWTFYYKNGKKWKEGQYKQDLEHGKWTTWWENGQLLKEGDFIEGKENGEWKQYFDNGDIKNEATFVNGQLNGEWKSYYKKEKIHISGHYYNNLKIGEWKTYSEKGKLLEEGQYKLITYKKGVKYGPFSKRKLEESVRDGHWVWYSDKDFKKSHEGDYKDGKETGTWTYYYPGDLKPCKLWNIKMGN